MKNLFILKDLNGEIIAAFLDKNIAIASVKFSCSKIDETLKISTHDRGCYLEYRKHNLLYNLIEVELCDSVGRL